MEQLKNQFRSYFNIEDSLLDILVTLFDRKELFKGDVYIHQGYICKELAFVKEGIFRISTQIEDKDITQWIATQGYFVSDLVNFVQYDKSRWTITALTDSTLYSISKSNYDKIGTFIPDWYTMEKSFLIHCFTILENRVLQFISMSAEERYSCYFEENRSLFNQIPQQYIASVLGMTPETLSRIRKKT